MIKESNYCFKAIEIKFIKSPVLLKEIIKVLTTLPNDGFVKKHTKKFK